jgi:hypothetical protein
MMFSITGFLDFSIIRYSKDANKKKFQKVDLFLSADEAVRDLTLLDAPERANLNHHIRKKAILLYTISKTL